MTTPNQPIPTTLETLLGIGAFEIGGADTNYGQDVNDNFVYSLLKLPAALMAGGLTEIPEAIVEIGLHLLTLPLDLLQAFASHLPGIDPSDFATLPGAVGAITEFLGGVPETVKELLTEFPLEVLQIFQGFIPGITHLFTSVFDAVDTITGLILSPTGGIIKGVLGLLGNNLLALPLEALQMFSGVIPGKTSDDFADSPTAVSTILSQFGLSNGLMSLGGLGQFVQAILSVLTGGIMGGDGILGIVKGIPFVGPLLVSFADMIGLFGDSSTLGLGTGFPLLGSLTSIPIFGPLLAPIQEFVESVFGGVFGGDPLTGFLNILTDIFSLFGGVLGLGTGDLTIPGLDAIPILGPAINYLLGIFGGALNLGEGANFFTSILDILGNPLGLLSGSWSLGAPGSIPIVGGVFNMVEDLLSDLLTIPSTIIGQLLQADITGLPAALTSITTRAQSIIDNIWQIFMGTGSGLNKTTTQLNDAGRAFYEILAQSPFNVVNLVREITENSQTKNILAGAIITPINSFIGQIKAWYDLYF